MDRTTTTDTTKLTKTARALTGQQKATLALRHTRNLAEVLFGEDVHASRVESLAVDELAERLDEYAACVACDDDDIAEDTFPF